MGRRHVLILGIAFVTAVTSFNVAYGSSAQGATLWVSFKADPRLATGTYGGDRWVSPATHTQSGDSQNCTVHARIDGLDAKKNVIDLGSPTWTSSDPTMVTITPAVGRQVTITVHGVGESTVGVSTLGMSKQLTIKAALEHDVLHVSITQK